MEETRTQIRWHLRPVGVVTALLLAGPFALALLWLSPAFKKSHKIVLTILVFAITIWLVKTYAGLYDVFTQNTQALEEILNYGR